MTSTLPRGLSFPHSAAIARICATFAPHSLVEISIPNDAISCDYHRKRALMHGIDMSSVGRFGNYSGGFRRYLARVQFMHNDGIYETIYLWRRNIVRFCCITNDNIVMPFVEYYYLTKINEERRRKEKK